MTARQRAWRTPELIVLTRTQAEEAVLEACKVSGQASGFNNMDGDCLIPADCLSLFAVLSAS